MVNRIYLFEWVRDRWQSIFGVPVSFGEPFPRDNIHYTKTPPKISMAEYERFRLAEITIDDLIIYDELVKKTAKDTAFLKMVLFEFLRIAPIDILTQILDNYEKFREKPGPKEWSREDWIEFAEKAKLVEDLVKEGKIYDFAIPEAGLGIVHSTYRARRTEARKLGYLPDDN